MESQSRHRDRDQLLYITKGAILVEFEVMFSLLLKDLLAEHRQSRIRSPTLQPLAATAAELKSRHWGSVCQAICFLSMKSVSKREGHTEVVRLIQNAIDGGSDVGSAPQL